MIKRYDYELHSHEFGPYGVMCEDADGEYVLYEDAAKLQSERDALAAEVAIAREYLGGISAMEPKHGMNAHARISDPQDMKIGWNTKMAAKHALVLMDAARTTKEQP